MTSPPPLLAPSPWTYRRVHAAACRLLLFRWLRRWAVFALVAAVLASAGAGLDSAAAAMLAVAAWAALPLAAGVASGIWSASLAVLASASLGLLLMAAVRQLIWPAAWRQAERALPLSRHTLRRSDLPWIALAALPWTLLQAAGLAVWAVQQPPWLLGREWALAPAGAAALALTLTGGLLLQRLRRTAGQPRGRPQALGALPSPAPVVCATPIRVLLWWPMTRGPARRFAWHSGLTLVGAAAVVAGSAWRPHWAAWWLAAQSLLALAAVSRARLLATLELRPLLEAGAPLPLSQARWSAVLDGAAAAPALVGAAGLAWLVSAATVDVRPLMLLVWWLWLALAAAQELRLPAGQADTQAARWLFMLAVAVALGSEARA